MLLFFSSLIPNSMSGNDIDYYLVQYEEHFCNKQKGLSE
jgi:hypothetical protein